MTTLPPEKWGLTEIADRWSGGRVLRQQTYGAATEMMLEVASDICPIVTGHLPPFGINSCAARFV